MGSRRIAVSRSAYCVSDDVVTPSAPIRPAVFSSRRIANWSVRLRRLWTAIRSIWRVRRFLNDCSICAMPSARASTPTLVARNSLSRTPSCLDEPADDILGPAIGGGGIDHLPAQFDEARDRGAQRRHLLVGLRIVVATRGADADHRHGPAGSSDRTAVQGAAGRCLGQPCMRGRRQERDRRKRSQKDATVHPSSPQFYPRWKTMTPEMARVKQLLRAPFGRRSVPDRPVYWPGKLLYAWKIPRLPGSLMS